MTTNSLYEIALNGLGLGTKGQDVDKMIDDHEGDALAKAILLNLGMALDDLQRAERQGRYAASTVASALKRFQDNASVANAEWLTKYAKEAEQYAREAQTAYTRVGEAWRLWKLRNAS